MSMRGSKAYTGTYSYKASIISHVWQPKALTGKYLKASLDASNTAETKGNHY